MLVKHIAEIGEIGKAAPVSGLLHLVLAADRQLLGVLAAYGIDIVGRCKVGERFEFPQKVDFAQPHAGEDRFDGQLAGQPRPRPEGGVTLRFRPDGTG